MLSISVRPRPRALCQACCLSELFLSIFLGVYAKWMLIQVIQLMSSFESCPANRYPGTTGLVFRPWSSPPDVGLRPSVAALGKRKLRDPPWVPMGCGRPAVRPSEIGLSSRTLMGSFLQMQYLPWVLALLATLEPGCQIRNKPQKDAVTCARAHSSGGRGLPGFSGSSVFVPALRLAPKARASLRPQLQATCDLDLRLLGGEWMEWTVPGMMPEAGELARGQGLCDLCPVCQRKM